MPARRRISCNVRTSSLPYKLSVPLTFLTALERSHFHRKYGQLRRKPVKNVLTLGRSSISVSIE